MAIISVTSAADSGAGSLREAVANAQPGDTIKFASNLANDKIILTSGEIGILKPLTFDGSDASNLAISGNQQSRIFNIGNQENRINVTIKDLAFVDGRAVAGTTSDQDFAAGGAIRIHDFSDVVVENSLFKNNVGERSGAIRVGFGGSLTVRNSTFDGNDGSIANDDHSAGAISTYGSGGIPDFDPGNGFVKIEGSTFTNNKGSEGGAVYSLLGPLTIEDSTFKNNESTRDGGAVFTDGADKSEKDDLGGEITIRRSVFESNKAKGLGGGLSLWTYNPDKILIEDSSIVGNSVTYGGGAENNSKGGGLRVNSGYLTIRNTTIANNTSEHQGGGAWIDGTLTVNIENSTFSGNSARDDMGGALTLNTPDNTPVNITNNTFVNNSAGRYSGAIWSNDRNSDDITLTNTIFAGNTASPQQMHTNYQLKDGGGNFVEKTVGDLGPKVTATATYVDDLKLSDTLQLVGNRLMYVLESGSPAISGGTTNGATTKDQRGVLRDSQPDAGAFEFVPNGQIPVPSSASSNKGNNKTDDYQVMTPVDSFIDSQKLLIDLRSVDLDRDGKVDSKVSVTLDDIKSDAFYNNSAGFYKIASADGAVLDSMTNKLIYPEDPGYAQAALKQRVSGGEINRNTGKLISQFDGGALYAPYLIANGTVEQFLNNPFGNLQAFFSQGAANLDKTNHVKLLDNNQFGFEDLLNAQDPDFNDLTFKVKIQSS